MDHDLKRKTQEAESNTQETMLSWKGFNENTTKTSLGKRKLWINVAYGKNSYSVHDYTWLL